MKVIFYREENGPEPVRNWLKGLDREDRRIIGTDIKTIEFGWPIGMPLCRPLGNGLYEIRSNLSRNRITRIIFSINGNDLYLLHGFIKKSAKTPLTDLALAKKRKKNLENTNEQ